MIPSKTNLVSDSIEVVDIASWINRATMLGGQTECAVWNEYLFIETLDNLKSLTRNKNPKHFLPQLIKRCAECGVIVIAVPGPYKSKVVSATTFLSDKKALMVLNPTCLSDDSFWHSFFHSAGHLVLHDKLHVFIDPPIKGIENIEENDANFFANEMLIPYSLEAKLKTLKGNKRRIINFAIEARISPGLLIGQLQRRSIIKPGYLNSYKRSLDLSKN